MSEEDGTYETAKYAKAYYKVESNNTLKTWAKTNLIKYKKTPGGHYRYFVPNNETCSNDYSDMTNYVYIWRRKSDLSNKHKELIQNLYPDHELVIDICTSFSKRYGYKEILKKVKSNLVCEIVFVERSFYTTLMYDELRWLFKHNMNDVNLICEFIDELSSSQSDSDVLSDVYKYVSDSRCS